MAQSEMARVAERVAEKEKETFESSRKRSMEILSETRERENQEDGKTGRRAFGHKEVINYMREKT